MDPTDIRYILDDLACNASQEALQELYMLYYKRIARYIGLYVRYDGAVMELTSDVFFAVWENRLELPEIRNFNAYIYRIAKFKALNYLRKRNLPTVNLDEMPLDLFARTSTTPEDDYRKAISFAAILPADDPEILVLVMMDDPRWIFDYASQIVAPVTGNIISQIAPYLGIERDASYDSNGSVEVPNAIGTRWTSAQVKMNAAGLSHRFVDTSDGDVVYQYPAGGTVVPAGSTVYLYTQSTTDATTTVPDATGKTGTFAAQMLKASGVNVAISGSVSDRVVSQDIEVGSVVPYGTVVTLTTEPDGSSDAQQDADTPQDDAAQDDTPQDAAGENDQDSTTQDDTGSDAEQQ